MRLYSTYICSTVVSSVPNDTHTCTTVNHSRQYSISGVPCMLNALPEIIYIISGFTAEHYLKPLWSILGIITMFNSL